MFHTLGQINSNNCLMRTCYELSNRMIAFILIEHIIYILLNLSSTIILCSMYYIKYKLWGKYIGTGRPCI